MLRGTECFIRMEKQMNFIAASVDFRCAVVDVYEDVNLSAPSKPDREERGKGKGEEPEGSSGSGLV